MKITTAASLIVGFMFTLSGCGQPHKGVKIIVEGGGKFPAELAGKWVCPEQGWTIELDKNGYIPFMIIPMGRTEMHPGKETSFEIPKYQGKAIYRPGLWTVSWSPATRELGITVELAYFYHDVGNHAVEGSTTDYLIGKVSEDGKTWKPDLQTMGFVDALLFEGWTLKERRNLFDDKEPVWRGEVVFQKE
ncbi:MAG: hypothetical protein KBI46_04925 [Phycisphaerae bacterium]|nr:hypothetical protein [Phycisphaerae bacterium]